MKKYQKEIVKLTAKELLMGIFDLALPFYEASRAYRLPAKKYKENRDFEQSNYFLKIQYLRRHGLIETFVKNKERFIEITGKGLKRIEKIENNQLQIERSKKWDGKWRIVIFDIPNKLKNARDIFRAKLLNLEFEKIQESVYVYPFECKKNID
jgi:hypothetical protein